MVSCSREVELYCSSQKPLNPLNTKIKIWILICCPYSFPTGEVGEVDKISSKFILCDHVHNSHDHSVLQSIDITRRNLMLITLKVKRVKQSLLLKRWILINFLVIIELFRTSENKGTNSRLRWTKYSDLYEPVQPNLDLMSLCLLTGPECGKGQ